MVALPALDLDGSHVRFSVIGHLALILLVKDCNGTFGTCDRFDEDLTLLLDYNGLIFVFLVLDLMSILNHFALEVLD